MKRSIMTMWIAGLIGLASVAYADPSSITGGGVINSNASGQASSSADLAMEIKRQLDLNIKELKDIAGYVKMSKKRQKEFASQLENYKDYINLYVQSRGDCRIMEDKYELDPSSNVKVLQNRKGALDRCYTTASFKLSGYRNTQTMITNIYNEMVTIRTIANDKQIEAKILDKNIALFEAQYKFLTSKRS